MNREIHLENMIFELESRIKKIEDKLEELNNIIIKEKKCK